jgi:hypothetical protein
MFFYFIADVPIPLVVILDRPHPHQDQETRLATVLFPRDPQDVIPASEFAVSLLDIARFVNDGTITQEINEAVEWDPELRV